MQYFYLMTHHRTKYFLPKKLFPNTIFSQKSKKEFKSCLKYILGLLNQQLQIYICWSFILTYPTPPPPKVKSDGELCTKRPQPKLKRKGIQNVREVPL